MMTLDLPAAVERPRLLLVDDQPLHLHALFEIFRDVYEVFVATRAEQAVQLAESQRPDLILSDIVIPGLSGLELCRKLKASLECRDIPLIFLTGQDSPEQEREGLDAGAVDFISKPFSPPVVRARVKTHLTLKAQADRLRNLAAIDGLTGIFNRRRFDEGLEHSWRSCRRSQLPMAVLMIDVDHFKLYNDSAGHPAGDEVLRQIATTLKTSLRRSLDLVARYGGEEFACLLPGAELAAGRQIAEYLRQAVFDLGLEHPSSPSATKVTISAGIAWGQPGPELPPYALVELADRNLYHAKRSGRNRCYP